MSNIADRKESCKSYLEQTKLLVTLATAFLIPPAFIYTVLKVTALNYLIWSEACFVLSVLFGYIVFGTIAGSQRSGKYDIYRPATRWFSVLQLLAYIAGIILFVIMCNQLDVAQDDHDKKQKVNNIQNQKTISFKQWQLTNQSTQESNLM